MGLEEFSSPGSKNTQPTTSTQQEQPEEKSKEDSFKVVECDRGREKVFPTEEDWEETVSYIEEEMMMSIDEVLNMRPSDRFQILHQAILKKNGYSEQEMHPKQDCVVCGERFVFPSNWNFTRIKGEAVCNDHSIGETMASIKQVNMVET